MLPAAALISALLLSGCGIKGPLYLPAKAQTANATGAQPVSGADHNKPSPTATQ